MTILVNIDHNAPHTEMCGMWHGFSCDCNEEMIAALEHPHCHECDFLHGSGYNRCNCGGKCLYPGDVTHNFECGVYVRPT